MWRQEAHEYVLWKEFLFGLSMLLLTPETVFNNLFPRKLMWVVLRKAISGSKYVNISKHLETKFCYSVINISGFTKSPSGYFCFLASSYADAAPSYADVLADSKKILKPKIWVLGISGCVGPNRNILLNSLKNHLTPTFDFINRFVKTNKNLVYYDFEAIYPCHWLQSRGINGAKLWTL